MDHLQTETATVVGECSGMPLFMCSDAFLTVAGLGLFVIVLLLLIWTSIKSANWNWFD